jgi:hypothetical protein
LLAEAKALNYSDGLHRELRSAPAFLAGCDCFIGFGHASPDTVMIYAKLYPGQLIEEYRKTVHSLYNAYYGEESLKNPTTAEWRLSRRAATCAIWARIYAPCLLESIVRRD